MALSDIVLSFGTAFVLYLAIEAPFRNIFSLMLVPHREQKPVNHTVNNNNNNNNNIPETKDEISETTCDSHL